MGFGRICAGCPCLGRGKILPAKFLERNLTLLDRLGERFGRRLRALAQHSERGKRVVVFGRGCEIFGKRALKLFGDFRVCVEAQHFRRRAQGFCGGDGGGAVARSLGGVDFPAGVESLAGEKRKHLNIRAHRWFAVIACTSSSKSMTP